MKRFAILILYNLLTFSIYAGIIPFPDLREKIARDPEGSLLLLDSLEKKVLYPNMVLIICVHCHTVHNPDTTWLCTTPVTR